VSAKLGFAAGLAVGLLAGSRAGRGLYDRSVSAANSVVHDPRVRNGATSALHKAGDAGSSVAGAAARKVKSRGKSEADGDGAEATDEETETEPGSERDALRGRTKRLIGGVRKRGHGVRVNGHGVRLGRPHLRVNGTDHTDHADHTDRTDRTDHAARHGGMSAPYVQPKPKNGSEEEYEGE
jgi:hypothetical protein